MPDNWDILEDVTKLPFSEQQESRFRSGFGQLQGRRVCLESLSYDILNSIFQYVPMNEYGTVLSLCKRINAIQASPQFFKNRFSSNKEVVKLLQYYQGQLSRISETIFPIEKVSQLQITEMSLKDCIFHPEDLGIFVRCFPHLQAIELAFSTIKEPSSLRILSQLSHLRTLKFADCAGLTDEHLQYLSLPSVEKISLACCNQMTNQVTDEGMKSLAQIQTLLEIDLSFCMGVTDAGWKHLVLRLPLLTRIVLDDSNQIGQKEIKTLRDSIL